MTASVFSIGNSALSAAYVALRTAGNNIANVNTPGYTRQTAILSPQVGSFTGAGYVGQGVAVADVRREYNEFLTAQAHQAQSAASAAAARHVQLAQATDLFGGFTTGIGATIDAFFRSLQDLAPRPGDAAARQNVISNAGLLAQRFNDVGERLLGFRDATKRQLGLALDQVNLLAQQVADLNNRISLAQGGGRAPNDLLDRRDSVVRELSAYIRVSSVLQDDGSVNLFLGNGLGLVIGSRATKMEPTADPVDPRSPMVGVRDGASLMPVDNKLIGGGSIEGLLRFASEDLPSIENEIGRLAMALTIKFNEQHRLGNDRNGNPGGDFFKPLAVQAFGALVNSGTGVMSASISDVTQLQSSDYLLRYAGGGYTLTRLADGTEWSSATPTFAVDGLNLTVAGTMADGDRIMVQPTRVAASDFRVAVALVGDLAVASPIRASVATGNTGTVTIDDLSVVGPTRNANLTQPATVTFVSASQYTITAGSVTVGPLTYSAGTPITFNGWSLTARGTPAAGDTVTIGPSGNGTGDNRNLLKLGQLVNAPLVDGSPLSVSFARAVTRIGNETRGAEVTKEAQKMILDDALNAESSQGGVNLDEEASRLMQFQQQYQAAAKMISAATRIFDEVLSIVR